MTESHYTPVPRNEDDRQAESSRGCASRTGSSSLIFLTLGLFGLAVLSFGLGFGVAWEWASSRGRICQSQSQSQAHQSQSTATDGNGLLLSPPQGFIPEIPTKSVMFRFPTEYEDTGGLGDRLWMEMMPVGAGFVRVPFPQMYELPPSKPIPGDHELAEIYSMSVTHQLHCLGVIRDVVIKYEEGGRSRFVGDGHEYHCIDYIRQAILCAGDTTLDHADVLDASGRPTGFTGANSAHQCRDWDAIKAFLIENRYGNRTGVLI